MSFLPNLQKAAFLGTVAAILAAAPVLAQSDAPLLDTVPEGTVLRVADPAVQKALEFSGLIDELTFEVEWANFGGGPLTSEAFRAQALDVGSVAEVPSIFATWTGLPVRNILAYGRVDPYEYPTHQFGVAPGVEVESIEDFAGKRIAFSPSQGGGALVLRTLDSVGLTADDVELLELPYATIDVYVLALANHQVDLAPLFQQFPLQYIEQYGKEGASLIRHGVRDDQGHLYSPQWVLDDPAKAAALGEYVQLAARAHRWIYNNPEQWIDLYYVDHLGVPRETAELLISLAGESYFPDSWDEIIAEHQNTINLLANHLGEEPFDAELNFDRRFETLAAQALAENEV